MTDPTISQAAREAGEMVALLRRDAEKLGGPLTETEMKGWVTPQRMLDAICAERFIAAADLISRLSATPIEALQQRVERLEVALRGLLSSYIGTCRFDGRVISEIEQHHCVIDARAALGDDVG